VKLDVDALESFAQLEPDRLIRISERDVEVELKIVFELQELWVDFIFLHFALENVSHEQMSDQVYEDQRTRACAERNVQTARFDLEASAHWSLNVEHLFDRAHSAGDSVGSIASLKIESSFSRHGRDGLCHPSCFRWQVHSDRLPDAARVLPPKMLRYLVRGVEIT